MGVSQPDFDRPCMLSRGVWLFVLFCFVLTVCVYSPVFGEYFSFSSLFPLFFFVIKEATMIPFLWFRFPFPDPISKVQF